MQRLARTVVVMVLVFDDLIEDCVGAPVAAGPLVRGASPDDLAPDESLLHEREPVDRQLLLPAPTRTAHETQRHR